MYSRLLVVWEPSFAFFCQSVHGLLAELLQGTEDPKPKYTDAKFKRMPSVLQLEAETQFEAKLVD